MKLSVGLCLFFILCLIAPHAAQAQVDSLFAQITSSAGSTFVRDISGDGRFVVFESDGDISTERTAARNNADRNTEIFLFDYAQRRIFQITNTRRVLVDNAVSPITQSNIFVEITNRRPQISYGLVNNELYIAFASNAAPSSSTTPVPAGANPGNFDGTALTEATARSTFAADANTEIFLYRVLVTTASVNLSSGIEIPLNDLSAGTFTRITNTPAANPSQPGTATVQPFISDDNREIAIDNDARTLAFVSNRNIITNGNNADFSSEIFVYSRTSDAFQQITNTPRSTANASIFNASPSLSGDGTKLAFYSNATTPRPDTTVVNGENADNNGEAFYATLNATGAPTSFTQITKTARVNQFETVVLFSIGRRISRDGRYIGFETLSNNPREGGTNQTGYQLYVFDTTVAQTNAEAYRTVGPRGDADPAAVFGDVRRFPSFTSVYDPRTNSLQPGVVFASRLNFRPDGTVPTTASEGLNPNTARPLQFFSYPLSQGTAAVLTRVSNFSAGALSEAQPFPSETSRRISFNIAVELGGGNTDFTNEAFYLLTPVVTTVDQFEKLTYATGASAIPVGEPQPTPTPTATPTPSPSPTATPTPQTPAAVRGVAPGMRVISAFRSDFLRPIVPATATGVSTSRAFPAPIELNGVSLSINGVAAGILRVDRTQISYVTPNGLTPGTYPATLNLNGVVIRGSIEIVAARPDIFRRDGLIAPLGRASVFNATNRVLQAEPFVIRTQRLRGGGLVQTRLRIFLTGVRGIPASAITIRIGGVTIPTANVLTGAVETDQPGIYSIDFLLPPEARGIGDQPIVVSVGVGAGLTSRLDDTAPRVTIVP